MPLNHRAWQTSWLQILLTICLLTPIQGQQTITKFTYFFGEAGEFMKLRPADNLVAARWNLAATGGLATVLPALPRFGGRKAGEIWPSPSEVMVDERLKRIYGVFPMHSDKTGPPGRVAVLVLALPEMRLIANLEAGDNASILITPDGGRLLVNELESSEHESKITSRVVVYSTDTFAKIAESTEEVDRQKYLMASVQIDNYFSKDAYFSQDGQFILDGLRITTVAGTVFSKKSIAPLDYMSPLQKSQTKVFETRDASSGKSFLPFRILNSLGGRTLVALDSPDQKRDLFMVVDLLHPRVLAMIQTTLSRARLVGGGTSILVEGIEVGKTRPKGLSRSYDETGSIAIYDAESGRLLKELTAPALIGSEDDHGVICASPDLAQIFYFSESQLFDLVPGGGHEASVRVSSDLGVNRTTRCVFSEE
jgi:hypothetical protein